MSVRRRLLVASLASLVVGLGALVVGGNLFLAARVGAEASNLLQARAAAQLAALSVHRGRITVRESPNDDLLDRWAWVLEGHRVLERPRGVSPALDQMAVRLGRTDRAAEVPGPDDIRLRADPVTTPSSRIQAGAVVVALSTEPLHDLQREVLVGSLIVAALVLVAAAFAIRTVLEGALRPVARMTASAEDWSAHDLDRRFDLGPPRDELTGLAATLDGLLTRIAASRRHEQRFASEMAHELRTPVAGIRGRAELALAERDERAHEAALESIVGQADRLDATIGTLMAVARRELDPAAGAVDLATVAREFEGVQLRLAQDIPLAEGEPQLVRRALAPLVENARRHASAHVWLDLSAGEGKVRLAVRDDGPGVHPELGERAFEPGVRGADERDDGAGLGLPLARRLARSCGGDVSIGPGPGGCFVLELPALGAGD
jgi:signal transduction histidine kinase